MFGSLSSAGRRPPGPAAHRPDRQPVDLRPQHGAGPAQHGADAARQRACCSCCRSSIMAFLSPLLTLIALAVGPGAVADRARVPAAGCSRPAGTRSSRPPTWPAWSTARSPACAWSRASARRSRRSSALEGASTPLYASRVRTVRLTARYNPALQAVPALGQVGVLALGGWLAINGADHARHVLRVLLLPRPAGRPGPGADRPDHDRPGGPGQRDPGVRGDRLPAGDHREAGRDGAARRARPTSSSTT